MKSNKMKAVVEYLSTTLRTIGIAAFMAGSLAILFNREEVIDTPAGVAFTIVIGWLLILLGLYLAYVAPDFEEDKTL